MFKSGLEVEYLEGYYHYAINMLKFIQFLLKSFALQRTMRIDYFTSTEDGLVIHHNANGFLKIMNSSE